MNEEWDEDHSIYGTAPLCRTSGGLLLLFLGSLSFVNVSKTVPERVSLRASITAPPEPKAQQKKVGPLDGLESTCFG